MTEKTLHPAQKSRTSSHNHQATRPKNIWKPQPCGISREDMRRIVLEMIG